MIEQTDETLESKDFPKSKDSRTQGLWSPKTSQNPRTQGLKDSCVQRLPKIQRLKDSRTHWIQWVLESLDSGVQRLPKIQGLIGLIGSISLCLFVFSSTCIVSLRFYCVFVQHSWFRCGCIVFLPEIAGFVKVWLCFWSK